MQHKSIKTYLKKLINDGHKWQYLSISGNGVKPKLYFTSLQWYLLICSIIAFYYLKTGFNSEFVGYIINALSIFIGLFLTLILTVFDKFKTLENSEIKTEIDIEYKTQRTNFFKQFTALTSYAIIIAIFCILLLSIGFATEFFKQNIFYLSIPLKNVYTISINYWRLLQLIFIAVYNMTVIYFLLDFILIVIYAVTSMHSYMMIEYNRPPKK